MLDAVSQNIYFLKEINLYQPTHQLSMEIAYREEIDLMTS
jgi:hypothetical protein